MLIQTGMMLTFGRLGDLYGHKMVYVGGLVVFMIGSILCGLTATPILLISARAFTALGSAALWANSAAILTHSFPSAQRGRALGMQSMMVQLGGSCGPPLGGVVASTLGWRAIFWVSVPVTFVALILSTRFIQRDEPVRARGAVRPGRCCPVRARADGGAGGAEPGPLLGVGLARGSRLLAAGGGAAGRVRGAGAEADLPDARPGAVPRTVVCVPVMAMVLNFVSTSSIVFLMPLYLLSGRRLAPAQAGLILITQPLVMASITILSGSLSDRIGSRIPATVGMLILSAGAVPAVSAWMRIRRSRSWWLTWR